MTAAQEENRLAYKKEGTTQGIPQVQYKGDINVEPSAITVPQKSFEVKTSGAENSGRQNMERSYDDLSDYEILQNADPMKDATNEEQRRLLTETQRRIKEIQGLQYELNGLRRKIQDATGKEKTRLENRAKGIQIKISEKVNITDAKINLPQLQNLLKARER